MTNAKDRAEAAIMLRKLLTMIEARQITASAGQLRRTEGAVIALEATTSEARRIEGASIALGSLADPAGAVAPES